MIRSDDNELHRLWQGDDSRLEPLPLAEIKARAAKLGRAIGKRNRREYAAAAFVVLIFGLYALILPGMLLKAGSLLVIAGSLIVAWQLVRRTSRADPAAEAADIRLHYRTRLEVEERMLASVGRWYIGPLVPGLAVFMAGLVEAGGFDSLIGFAAFTAVPTLVIIGIWLLNREAAAMLRQQIDRLDATAPVIEGEKK